jgi:hypothetical protein
MPDSSTKAKRDAWHRAKKAIDAVEARALGKKEADAPGGAAHQERLLLDRLRHEKSVEQVGEAWLRIEPRFKKGDEGERVIRGLLHAFTLARHTKSMPIDYGRSMRRLKELRGFADQLHKYLTDEVARDPMWAIVAGSQLSNERNFKNMVASLEHIRLFLTLREEEFSRHFDQIGLTREVSAAAARHVVFSAALSTAMHDIFGIWLDDVVRILTDVVLGKETSVDQVKHARRAVARRRVRTQAPKT